MLRAAGMQQKDEAWSRTKPGARDARPVQACARHARRPLLAGPRSCKSSGHDPEYERAVARLAESLRGDDLADAVEIASLPGRGPGYEHLKLARARRYRLPSSPSEGWPRSADARLRGPAVPSRRRSAVLTMPASF